MLSRPYSPTKTTKAPAFSSELLICYNDYMDDDEKDLQLLDEELNDSDRDDGDMLACGE